MDAIIQSGQKNYKKSFNPKNFRIVLIFFHILGFALFIGGIVIGVVGNRIIFDKEDEIIFAKNIDIATYVLITFGTIILSSIMVYWTIYLMIKKQIGSEKLNNQFNIQKWKKYAHIINADKVKKQKLRKWK